MSPPVEVSCPCEPEAVGPVSAEANSPAMFLVCETIEIPAPALGGGGTIPVTGCHYTSNPKGALPGTSCYIKYKCSQKCRSTFDGEVCDEWTETWTVKVYGRTHIVGPGWRHECELSESPIKACSRTGGCVK